MSDMKLSVIIPAYNEEANIPATVERLRAALEPAGIPYELILVNDNSRDQTGAVIHDLAAGDPRIVPVDRIPPGGFGRAIRSGLERATGEAIIVFMADCSDSPDDVIRYYRKLEEGYDCVFGSRFIEGSSVRNYPTFKLICNRIVNTVTRLLFWCPFNDLTNAFKAYRRHVIEACSPYQSCHFNLTVEMSLRALIRNYAIAQIPIGWEGRTWGMSSFSIRRMGRRYLEVIIRCLAEKMLVADDLMAERLRVRQENRLSYRQLEARLEQLEKTLETHRHD